MRLPEKIDLYNNAYGNNAVEVYSELRRETYGIDLGQTSWMDAAELAEIPGLLKISAPSKVLEIGCGAGGCALHLAATLGCHVTGIDANVHGVRAARSSAQARRLADRVSFQEHDAAQKFPLPDHSFDAVYSNDAFCHIPNRLNLLRECRRVIKPGARILFSDALVVNGFLTNEEIATRSSIGYYIFVPREENERLIQEAGFTLIEARDTTRQAANISRLWHDARARRRDVLQKIEGETNFEGLQKFLTCVHTLTSSNRLARVVYVAEK